MDVEVDERAQASVPGFREVSFQVQLGFLTGRLKDAVVVQRVDQTQCSKMLGVVEVVGFEGSQLLRRLGLEQVAGHDQVQGELGERGFSMLSGQSLFPFTWSNSERPVLDLPGFMLDSARISLGASRTAASRPSPLLKEFLVKGMNRFFQVRPFHNEIGSHLRCPSRDHLHVDPRLGYR